MDDLIQTPYGYVRAKAFEDLRSSYDTRQILKAVDDLDRFCAQWKKELRDDLLQTHAMVHTVINDAPLASVASDETLGEAAYSIAEELRDWQQSLQSAITLLDQITELEPD
jgi:hypothetical protein